MFKNILVVCVGNICRSPMAEGLLRHALVVVHKTECHVSSAGLSALVGHHADPSACQLMMKKGIDISGHRACQLNTEMIRKADLVLVMEQNQKAVIIESERSARGKVYRLGEWGKFDVEDPYRKEIVFFERSLTLIEQGVSHWIEKL